MDGGIDIVATTEPGVRQPEVCVLIAMAATKKFFAVNAARITIGNFGCVGGRKIFDWRLGGVLGAHRDSRESVALVVPAVQAVLGGFGGLGGGKGGKGER